MAKYRKMPAVIEAVRWEGDLETLNVFPDDVIKNARLICDNLHIKTLCGEIFCNIGDYIVRGTHGEYYMCSRAIFEETHELTEQSV